MQLKLSVSKDPAINIELQVQTMRLYPVALLEFLFKKEHKIN